MNFVVIRLLILVATFLPGNMAPAIAADAPANKNKTVSKSQNVSDSKDPKKLTAYAGWTYATEGGGGGTEPYSIWGDDTMCRQIKSYMNKVAPNWKPSKKGATLMENSCTSAVQLFPRFAEPPWTELDPRLHEELLARLLRYRAEGARGYWNIANPPNRRDDSYYREGARHFIGSGGRMQYWKTRLLDLATDPMDNIRKPLPPGDQHVIQLRYAINYSINARSRHQTCRRSNWRGATFLVTEDLSGPDPKISDGSGGPLSSSTLLVYEGMRILLDDSGNEIHVERERSTGNDFVSVCELKFPYHRIGRSK